MSMRAHHFTSAIAAALLFAASAQAQSLADLAKKEEERRKSAPDSGKIYTDKAYWSGRLKALQDQVDQNQTYVDAIQTRINALTTDFVNRDDPAQRSVIERDRQKALAELTRLKQAIVDGKKSIANVEEEARR